MKLFIEIVMKWIYLFNIVAWNYRNKIGFPVCKKENFAGLKAHRKRGKSARASPTPHHALGSLSSDVFARRTSTGSEPFSLLVSLDVTVFILPSVLILIETICPKICSKSRLKSAKCPLPIDVRRSKTSLLKLPIKWRAERSFHRPTFIRPGENWQPAAPPKEPFYRQRSVIYGIVDEVCVDCDFCRVLGPV